VAIPPSSERLQSVDLDLPYFKSPPVLPDYTTPDEYVQLMDIVEKSEMPVGFYGWHGALYVLWKENILTSDHPWHLTKISVNLDEDSGKVMSTDRVGDVTLPSEASHLLLVPGDKYWAVLEKGPIEGFGIQDEHAVRFIPSQMLEDFRVNSTLCK